MKTKLLLLSILICETVNAQTPDYLWAKSAGGISSDQASSLGVDASGNTYIAGSFNSPNLSFGSSILTNTGTYDIFLAKYDASGNILWAKSAGGADQESVRSMKVDDAGNTYIAGSFNSPTITFGSTTLTSAGSYAIFLAKYDSFGNVLWAKSAGGTSNSFVNSIAIDTSGNAYIAGYFGQSLSFGSTTLTSVGWYDIFLTKYDASGNVLWAKSAGSTSEERASCIAVGASGNINIAGYFAGSSLSFGSTTLTDTDTTGYTREIFLAQYDASGSVLWAKGGTSGGLAGSLAVDATGNTYLTVVFQTQRSALVLPH